MPEYKELTVSLVANQDAELRTVIGALVQQLGDRYIVVEQGDGDLGVLNVADLAWLPYGKTLADLGQYFRPTFKVDRALHTDDEIMDAAAAHSDAVGLLYHGDEFEMLISAPPTLDGGGTGRCQRVRCQNCQSLVVLCDNRRICPVCSKYAV